MHDQEFVRYSRQLMLPECSLEQQEKLKHCTVLIAGLGGLGCPVAQYLAGAGVGHLLLADLDTIDLSNLQRQTLYGNMNLKQPKTTAAKQRLQAVNSGVKFTEIPQGLTAENLPHWVSQADLILDCSDNFQTRKAINQACIRTQKPLISASAIGFSGQLAGFFPPFEQGCYDCLYPDDSIPNLNCQTAGVLGPVVGIVGCLQALEALKFLLGLEVSCAGKLLIWEAKTWQWQVLRLSKNQDCRSCNTSLSPLAEGANNKKGKTMQIYINQQPISVQSTLLHDVLTEAGFEPKGLAVAVNQQIISKTEWEQTTLNENDQLTVFKAIAGG